MAKITKIRLKLQTFDKKFPQKELNLEINDPNHNIDPR
jgi:hypothetical protein